jgi:hypothetical protein
MVMRLSGCAQSTATRASPIPPCVLVSRHLDEETYEASYGIGVVPLPKHYLLHPNVLLTALGSALGFFGAPSRSDEVDSALDHPWLPRRRSKLP